MDLQQVDLIIELSCFDFCLFFWEAFISALHDQYIEYMFDISDRVPQHEDTSLPRRVSVQQAAANRQPRVVLETTRK